MINADSGNAINGTILVVDDNRDNLSFLSNMLRKNGYAVRAAISGSLAIETVNLMLPDLVLLDVKMPEMDGYEVCKRLKADDRTREVPVIFISALEETLDKVRAFNVGGVDYVTKPFQFDEVLARVGTHIALRNLQIEQAQINERLRRSQEELEQRVAERTAELLAVNERLKSEIIERQRHEEAARKHQEKLFHAAKMVSLGTLVSGVAHEINNPNTFILSNAPILQKVWRSITPILDNYCEKCGDFAIGHLSYLEVRDSIPDLLAGVLEGAKRINKIVSELTDFARPRPQQSTESVDINAVVRTALTFLLNLIKSKTDHFTVDYGRDLPTFRGNAQRIEQVVINLLVNACEALRNKQESLAVATFFDSSSDQIILEVRDQGIGIADEDLARICDPFFSTKRDLGGTGLGLSISSRIIADHGGTISFQSSPGGGTRVTVILPAKCEQFGASNPRKEPS